MHSVDWGHITPESVNMLTKDVTYVFNHDLSSAEKIDRTVRFIVGRLQYYDLHLPPDPTHIVKIDVRGQLISDEDCKMLKSAIVNRYNKRNSLVIEIISS